MKLEKYKKGNIIFFYGQNKKNMVFLLKSGMLHQTRIYEGRLSKKKKLSPGAFFGIKCGFGARKVDETIQALTDVEIYVLDRKEFVSILEKKPKIIFAILQIFFGELRNSHREIEKYMNSDADLSNDKKLFHIGEYYESKEFYDRAIYVYQRILKLYPDRFPELDLEGKIQVLKTKMADQD